MDVGPLLQYIANYIELSSVDEHKLLDRLRGRNYLKGQFLVQQGDICPHLSFVLSGSLRTFHVDREGHEHTIRFALENWWVADMASFAMQSPSDTNVQFLEPSSVLQISREAMTLLFEEVPTVERLFRIIYQNAFIQAEKRITNNLSLTATERYQAFQQQYPQIEQRVPQYMIASYLGITRQYLSEIRQQLAR